MDRIREAAVRARAYQLWIESGYADGQQDSHWRQAEREVAEKEKATQGQSIEDVVADAASRAGTEPAAHSDGTSHHPSIVAPTAGRTTG